VYVSLIDLRLEGEGSCSIQVKWGKTQKIEKRGSQPRVRGQNVGLTGGKNYRDERSRVDQEWPSWQNREKERIYKKEVSSKTGLRGRGGCGSSQGT